jgi:hypothetical protein
MKMSPFMVGLGVDKAVSREYSVLLNLYESREVRRTMRAQRFLGTLPGISSVATASQTSTPDQSPLARK